jgi:hypothetical protein
MAVRTSLRNNAILVAAAALPVLVAGFFLAASAISQWTVAPPAYDLVFRAANQYAASPSRITVDFHVRDARIEAVVRPAVPNTYVQQWTLFLFDHVSGTVRELPLDVPASLPAGEESRTILVDGLGGRRVSAQRAAPDGYELQSRAAGAPGLVGELFGMGRYGYRAVLVNRGRTLPLSLPSPYQDPYQSPVIAVGWVVDER